MPPARKPRVYSSRANTRPALPSPSSSQAEPCSSPPATPPRKRPLADASAALNSPPAKRRALARPGASKPLTKGKGKAAAKLPAPKGAATKPLQQLHFILDAPTLRACAACGLSYTRAAPDDERLHRAHCLRVRRGLEWGRDEERARGDEVVEVERGVRLSDGSVGRVVAFRCDIGGKIGSKLTTLLETVNLALSSPPLTDAALKASKAYLFLVPSSSATSASRELIAGCVVAQRIETALALAPGPGPGLLPVHIDPATSLYVRPTPVPAALGVARVFVAATRRRCGVARVLLAAAARTFVHGCPLDPAAGAVAFSQPTLLGRAVMQAWGGDAVRIYEE